MKRSSSLLLAAVLLAGCGHPTPGTAASRTSAAVSARDTGDVAQIRTIATTCLAAAAGLPDWNARYASTDKALNQIMAVPLTEHGLSNLVAKLGLFAVEGYGWIGFKPQPQTQYQCQVVALQYLAADQSDAALAQGAAVFTLAGNILAAAATPADGFKVGMSVLCTMRDFYKDQNLAREAGNMVQTALRTSDRVAAFAAMQTGLKQLGAAAED